MHIEIIGAPGRLLVGTIFVIGLLSSCTTKKATVDPYEARQQREAAMEMPKRQPQLQAQAGLPSASVTSTSADQDILLPTMTLINDRIYAYEQKLQIWKSLQGRTEFMRLEQQDQETMSQCRAELQSLLVEYNALHQRLLQKSSLEAAQLLAGESLLSLGKRDIEYLESDCRMTLQGGGNVSTQTTAVAPLGRTLHAEEQQLKQMFELGDYGQVIALYHKLPLEPGQLVPLDMTYLYGQALMKSQREAEARKVFVNLLDLIREQDQAQWEFRLMQLIGDLEFGLGVYDAARAQYEEVTGIYSGLNDKNEWARKQLEALDVRAQQGDEVRNYAALLKSHLGYNPERDGYGVVQQAAAFIGEYPYSPVASNADYLLAVNRKLADAWFETVLQRADVLAGEKKFQEALLLIERVPQTILPPDKQVLLRGKTEELTTSESISIETERLVEEQTVQEDWNTAMSFLEAKEYDQAIEVFTRLFGTSYEAKARNRIDEAAGLAAKDDRQRAAELFVRANRTQDQESRKKLLFASRQLLQDILVKYPQSGLTDKVRRNLSRIEEEIRTLDPALLTAPSTVGGNAFPEQSSTVESTGTELN